MNETNKYERIAALKAMALLAKSANDETAIEYWLTYGIADGDEHRGARPRLRIRLDDIPVPKVAVRPFVPGFRDVGSQASCA